MGGVSEENGWVASVRRIVGGVSKNGWVRSVRRMGGWGQ